MPGAQSSTVCRSPPSQVFKVLHPGRRIPGFSSLINLCRRVWAAQRRHSQTTSSTCIYVREQGRGRPRLYFWIPQGEDPWRALGSSSGFRCLSSCSALLCMTWCFPFLQNQRIGREEKEENSCECTRKGASCAWEDWEMPTKLAVLWHKVTFGIPLPNIPQPFCAALKCHESSGCASEFGLRSFL